MGVQKLNKKGISFKLALFSIIGISMIITSVGIILDAWSSNYNSGINQDLDEFNELDAVSDVAREQQEGISPQTAEPGSDFEARSFKGGFGIINSILNSFDVVFGNDGMVASVGNRFGVPSYIIQGIFAFMTIAITMGIIAIIFRLNRDSI